MHLNYLLFPKQLWIWNEGLTTCIFHVKLRVHVIIPYATEEGKERGSSYKESLMITQNLKPCYLLPALFKQILFTPSATCFLKITFMYL